MANLEANVRRFFEEVWNQGNVVVADEFLAAEFTSHNNFDVTILGTRTRVPSGTAAATGANSWETAAPVATVVGSTPTSAANLFLATATESAHGSQLVRPARQSSSDCCSASHAGRGGGP